MAFLEKLLELRSLTPMAPAMTRAMARMYSLDGAKNCEERVAWYRVRVGVWMGGREGARLWVMAGDVGGWVDAYPCEGKAPVGVGVSFPAPAAHNGTMM